VALSRERVLDAALAVAAREGFERLSMREVARDLDVSPMALYRHVANKDDLLDGVVALLLGEIALPEESLPWEQRLRLLAGEVRALARRRSRAFGLLLTRRAVGEGATRARAATLAALADAGLDREAAARSERLLSTLVMGFALSEASGRFDGIDVDGDFNAALELLSRVVHAT